MGYIRQEDIQPITAKEYLVKNWKKYNVADTEEGFIALLNILQACGENLDSLHDVFLNGYVEFCDIFHGKSFGSDREVADTLLEFCTFYKEKEFIDMILDKRTDYETSAEWSEAVFDATSDNNVNDTQITKTEDGYVVRVWY